jgi:hypothetical protein
MKVFFLDVETMKLRQMNKKMATELRAEMVFPYKLPWSVASDN